MTEGIKNFPNMKIPISFLASSSDFAEMDILSYNNEAKLCYKSVPLKTTHNAKNGLNGECNLSDFP